MEILKVRQPLVSVVIPCYNHENFVKDCIQSVIDQTYENIELIIIDDGSKDNSVEKIQEMISTCKERFFRFEFRHRPNKGLSATLNEALEWCQGVYYSAIASDDIIYAEKISIQVEYLEKDLKLLAVFGGVEIIDNNNTFIRSAIPSNKNLIFKNIFLSNYTIFACTQLIRLNAVKKLGNAPYPSHIIMEDIYMWLKLSEKGCLKNLPYIFAKYRVHDSNTMKKIELINQEKLNIINEFSYSKYYDRAIRIANLTSYYDTNKRIPSFFFIFKHPKLLIDFIFYKKIILYIYLKYR